MNTKGFFKIVAPPMVASLAMFLAGPVAAVEWNDGIVEGENTIEDQDREAYFDVDSDGTVSVGDVFVGYVRVDDFLPSGASADDQVYAVFSQQIDSFAGDNNEIIIFDTTTTAGLTLQDVTGDADTTGGLFAVYDQPGSYGNLITAPVGDELKDNTDHIVDNGTLRLVGGLVSDDNFFHTTANAGFGGGASTEDLDAATTSVTIGNFTGGLSVIFNNTAFEYANTRAVNDAFGNLFLAEFGIGAGTIRGGGSLEDIYGDGSGFGAFTQCMVDGVNTICGFESDADFFVDAQRVPEPGTLMLFGSGLLGLAFFRRRVKKI